MARRGDYAWLRTRAAGLLPWKDRKVTAFPFGLPLCPHQSLGASVPSDHLGTEMMNSVIGCGEY
jgi:hypothetical protein